ncbi:hypothetical protein JRO89_XS04G0012500 [Xanthoceras sorbifolium]|uniref:RNA polymerase II subunit B1 CTD phosphatase RPAP2 homolog n=1 Tax=Xanthoceras sorbifolium TaxID=99658 RepID=A0ABQ8I4H9_9ROSI|nr:hypothetical protein JRO89_XS04G0012500 [Xanthoceras sorbifolium]
MAVKAVNDAVHRLQLSLLEGVGDETRLLAAGSLMSRRDYEDVVTERSIANLCGYPLCSNSLPPSDSRPRKGRYRISLKEHKVYDVQEMYLYCSTECLVNSKAFCGSLKEERCLVSNPSKIDEVLRLFDELKIEEESGGGRERKVGDGLEIKENVETKVGEMVAGPSDAIEGYIPQPKSKSSGRHTSFSMRLSLKSKSKSESSSRYLNFDCIVGVKENVEMKVGGMVAGVSSKAKTDKKNNEKGLFFSDMDIMSTIITNDEYSVSKTPSGTAKLTYNSKLEEPKGKEGCRQMKDQCDILGLLDAVKSESSVQASRGSRGKSKIVGEDEVGIQEGPSTSVTSQTGSNMPTAEAEKQNHAGKAVILNATTLKSSLKSSSSKKLGHSVTWADEKVDSSGSGDLCEVRDMADAHYVDDDEFLRFASAEACAVALSQAVETISTEESDANDAVSEAGIIILPRPDDVHEGESTENVDTLEQEAVPPKWPSKPGIPRSDLFDPEDSWYEAPPEGFSLTLSPFATMWMAIFAWVTSSSLAYIYGKDDSFHEEYLSVNGREYPRKIVLGDGRSSEIKQTLAGCLARALPGLVADLRLPIPISRLEHGVGRLLDTMSFMDPLPAFRMKQWQVIVLLFIDALSVSRIPALTSYMINRTMLLRKVLDSAQISTEEYEVMKDFMIPLGRASHFSTQSGA